MENLHEQIKAYIPKLEYSIREYMRNPATPNAAQGIMAMVECLNMLKGAEGAICTGREMTKADAEAWADHMENEDGTTNMMYSDYGSVAIHYGVSTAEFFAELAQAFLFDKDGPGPKEKLAAYYHGIVKAGE